MASHENQEGWLDYGSGRYKLIGHPGLDDHYLHAGEWVDMWIGTQWVAVQVLADEWGAGTSWIWLARLYRYNWGYVPDCETSAFHAGGSDRPGGGSVDAGPHLWPSVALLTASLVYGLLRQEVGWWLRAGRPGG